MPDDKIIPFGTARAMAHNDNTAWSPREALLNLVAAIDAGETDIRHMAIVFQHHVKGDPEGTLTIGKLLCNMDRSHEISLYELMKHHALHDWHKDF